MRVWVPACASGEEAYSIAILLKEAMEKQKTAPKVQVFATDIDEHAITLARAARYPESHLAHLSAERRNRWFTKESGYYCPVRDIREICVFSAHSVIKDPPFSKLDLISCRNLLIYFDAPLQERVIRTFHYALKPGGHLFLGNSEGVGRQGRLFKALDKKHRIFQRSDEMPAVAPHVSRAAAGMVQAAARAKLVPTDGTIEKHARRAMDRHVPAHVVVSQNNEVLRFSGQTDLYFGPSAGPASLNIYSLLRKSLRPAVRALLQRAATTRQPAVHENLPFQAGGKRGMIDLIVEAIPDGLYVIAFREKHAPVADSSPANPPEPANDSLERELFETRERLQTAVDEMESANEELKSSNEEYQSVNEELQSTNEELETSKEEMQSVNEELQTLNGELLSKNELLMRLNSDLSNLKNSTHIATIFLDENLLIRDFTPATAELLHVRDHDRGRPVTEIASRLSYDQLPADVAKVVRTLSAIDREIALPDTGATFLMRMWPYRTVANTIDGVVITFVDITERKRYEQERAALAAIVASSFDAVIGLTLEGIITSWNPGAEQIFGYAAKEAIGKSIMLLVPPERADEEAGILERIRKGERVDHFNTVRLRKDRELVDVSLSVSPIRDAKGHVAGISKIARDISLQRQREKERTILMGELHHRVKNTLTVVQSIAAQTLRGAQTVAQAREALGPRLMALSRVQDVLLKNGLQQGFVRDIANLALGPFGGSTDSGKITVSGADDLLLEERAATTVMLTLHELATNAVKYGSLSAAKGKVRLKWRASNRGGRKVLTLSWEEIDGPEVKPPTHRGFGTSMIERSWQASQGSAELKYNRSGLKAVFKMAI